MLKAKRRKDLNSKVYYVTGTFYFEGESRYVKNRSCRTTEKREANKFVYKLIEDLKRNISQHKSKEYSAAADLKIADDDSDTAPSQKTIKLIEKTKKYLGQYDIRTIDHYLIRKKAYECYPME